MITVIKQVRDDIYRDMHAKFYGWHNDDPAVEVEALVPAAQEIVNPVFFAIEEAVMRPFVTGLLIARPLLSVSRHLTNLSVMRRTGHNDVILQNVPFLERRMV